MGAKGATVEFRSVTKRYGNAIALERFSLQIAEGEFVTLLGPSGSGKTTALNILAGFTDATEGEVEIGGRTVTNLPPEKRNLGMVFQNFSLFPHLTVFENVAFPLRLRKYPKTSVHRTVMESLETVHLTEYAARMPRTLSGGQQQRVAIARSIAFRPPVLLMDESLSALDLKLREALQAEIKRLHREIGCTILFVTHDQGEALALSDRVAVMRNGSILQVDTPQAIYDCPAHRFVAEFIGDTNILPVQKSRAGTSVIAGMEGSLTGVGCGHISLRPERIRRVAENEDLSRLIVAEGHVTQVRFRGASVYCDVLLPSGHTIEFHESRGEGRPIPAIGDLISIGFHPDDVVMFGTENQADQASTKI